MTVPKTSLNKNHSFVFRQHDVRSAGQIFDMDAKPETLLVKIRPYE
jgi:hypothetical protein